MRSFLHSMRSGALSRQQELQAMVANGGLENEFEVAYIVDADDTISIEIICDCCKGFGHVRRVCPSNRNRSRSYQYAIAGLQSKLDQLAKKGPPRRPPGRGQRAPFRPQPRRFQPQQRNAAGGRRFNGPPRPQFGRSAEEGDDEDEVDESGRAGTEQKDGAKPHPTTFDDDSLFAEEAGLVCSEIQPDADEPPSPSQPSPPQPSRPHFLLMPIVTQVSTALALSLALRLCLSEPAFPTCPWLQAMTFISIAILAYLIHVWESLSRLANSGLLTVALLLLRVVER